MPDRTVSSPEAGVVEISDKAGECVKLFVDEKTGLPVKEIYRSAQPMGAPGAMEEIFEDFVTGGIKVPSKITVNQNGKKFAELTMWNTNSTPASRSKTSAKNHETRRHCCWRSPSPCFPPAPKPISSAASA